MADDPKDTGGFDDWLEEEPGPDTDPYAELASEEGDLESEIADWMAFTEGTDTPSESEAPDGVAPVEESAPEAFHDSLPAEGSAADTEPETEQADQSVSPVDDIPTEDSPEGFDADELSVIPAITVDAEDSAEPATDSPDEADGLGGAEDDEEVTGEIAVTPVVTHHGDEDSDTEPATSVDFGEWQGDDRADTEEVPIVSGADVVEASVTNLQDVRPSDEQGLEPLAFDESILEDADLDDAADEAPFDEVESHEDTDELHAIGAFDAGEADQIDEIDPIDGIDEFDDADVHEDTGEMEVIPFPVPAEDEGDHDTSDDVFGDLDDDAVGAVSAAAAAKSFGDLWDDDTSAVPVGEDDADDSDDTPFDLSNDDYLQTATREHAGLAAAIAEAEGESTEQVALAAPIPGLESTVVGFEDVVEAEGHSRARSRRSGDLLARVLTAIVLIAAFAASLVWRPALVALATVVFVIGAGEFYTALARSGRQPVSIFGFVGILGATVGGYVWGPIAIPVAFLLVVTMLLLFYAVVPGRRDPMANLALTVTVMAWAGLGAFAGPIAVADDYRVLIVGVVLTVAVMDIVQYFVGRSLGRHQLAPWVSPKKTIEGLVGGVIVALALGALLDFVDPFDLSSGLAIGAAVAVLVPLGDLAMSAAKRSLGLKDMGSILPGHGGFLDRIDGLLFSVPAAWAIFMWAGLL